MEEDEDFVFYCANCLSLNIRRLPCDLDYCMECNCANIERAKFEEWEKKYKNKYHEKLIKDGK